MTHSINIFLITFLILTQSCKKRNSFIKWANENDILLYGNGAEPNGLDPHIVTGVTENNIISALSEGLVGFHPKTLAPQTSAGAHKWKISKDLLTYTFYLRKNAKWSNGDPVKAQDYVYSYNRILHPNFPSQYEYMLYPLKNSKKYKEGKIIDFSQVGVKAIDDFTLEIKLNSPTPYLLSLLTHYATFPVHPPTIEKHGGMLSINNKWIRTENYTSNGAFTLKKWKLNSILKVEKNNLYWDKDTVKLKEIWFYPIDNQETEQRAFQQGMLHVTNSPPPHRITWAKQNSPESLKISEYQGVFYICVNLSPIDKNDSPQKKKVLKALKDIRVRKALAIAIDRGIICDFMRGGNKPAFQFTPPNVGGYTPKAKIKPNLAKAKKLLADAGYPNGKNLPPIKLLYPISDTNTKLSELIQSIWKERLGINIELEGLTWKAYLSNMQQQKYQLSRAAWIGDYNDPSTFLNLWVTGGGNNRALFSNKQYDSYINKAKNETDTKKRITYFQSAEAILTEQLPVIPIYFYVRVAMISPYLKGWELNVLDLHPYKYLSLIKN